MRRKGTGQRVLSSQNCKPVRFQAVTVPRTFSEELGVKETLAEGISSALLVYPRGFSAGGWSRGRQQPARFSQNLSSLHLFGSSLQPHLKLSRFWLLLVALSGLLFLSGPGGAVVSCWCCSLGHLSVPRSALSNNTACLSPTS